MIRVDLKVYQHSFIYRDYVVFYQVDKSDKVTIELLKVLLDAVYYKVIDKLTLNSKLYKVIDKSKFQFFQSLPGEFRFFEDIPSPGKENLMLGVF